MASGTLAAMIPPSALGVLLGVVGDISIGRTLIAIIIPGLLMALVYAAYIVIRCKLQPSLAPGYQVGRVPVREKLTSAARNIVPVGAILFLVNGVIFLGIATPSEAAATGALGCFALAAAQKTLNWQVVKKSAFGTVRVAGMILMILVGATLFSRVMAASGGTQGLVEFVIGLDLPPIIILIFMQVVVLFLGCLMEAVSIMMITVPLFMPIINALGFDPVWFAVMMLICLEVGPISPPFGLVLFVMKGVAPPDTTMGDIFKAAIPFCICDVVALALVTAFPAIALWLPNVMR
jgi:tripartite ATP-independent transporter DctM subunit